MDIIAGILELVAIWIVGNRNKYAFILFVIANILWIITASSHHMYGLILVCVPAVFINIHNFIKWRKDEARQSKNN